MILELRDVTSLTEARYAAGEGFTHIRIGDRLIEENNVALIEGIKGFLSGMAVGCNRVYYTPALAATFHYYASADARTTTLHTTNDNRVLELETISLSNDFKLGSYLPTMQGFSIQAPGEEETGVLADYSTIETILDDIRNQQL